jgi:inorganic phosphate transporter, PiT family
MYLRSKRTPVDHHNVNDEWEAAPAAAREPAGTAS